jgi:lysophospholipase L1-like esterase
MPIQTNIIRLKNFTPIKILLFLLSSFAVLSLVSAVFPENGIYLGNYVLHFPAINSFLTSKKEEKKDISKIMQLADMLDSIPANQVKQIDSVADRKLTLKALDSTVQLITGIQFPDESHSALHSFFESLVQFKSNPSSLRILHYGDSQIEGDRITDFLRIKYQSVFGGGGPGWVNPLPITQAVGYRINWSDNWERYTCFAGRDKRVPHNSFGPGAAFCRFAPYSNAIPDTSNVIKASVKINSNLNGGPRLASYSNVRIFYGNAKRKCKVELYENGIFKESDSLEAGGNFKIKNFAVSGYPPMFELKFSGYDSPDIYGISLQSHQGIIVDNFGLRGSSGTFFHQINNTQLQSFYDYLNVKLVILQFGGNALPAITSPEMASGFGNFLKSQIRIIRKLIPGVSILVIGPSDMSVKNGEIYETHPQLENLRNAIRKAAFETNCGFFDMYDCMGGKNSMLTWVEQGIAAKDYIHFSPAGARKIATLLYAALNNEFIRYSKTREKL